MSLSGQAKLNETNYSGTIGLVYIDGTNSLSLRPIYMRCLKFALTLEMYSLSKDQSTRQFQKWFFSALGFFFNRHTETRHERVRGRGGGKGNKGHAF